MFRARRMRIYRGTMSIRTSSYPRGHRASSSPPYVVPIRPSMIGQHINNYVLASHKDVPAGAGSSAQASNNEDEAVPRPSVGLMIPIRHGLIGCVS
jgi:hypothetical protein